MAQQYEKRQSDDGTWMVVETTNEWTVTMDGLPLDDLEEREADEAVELLESGALTPDTPHAPPPAN